MLIYHIITTLDDYKDFLARNTYYPEEVELFGNQKSNLNGSQIRDARCFLANVYGVFCGAGSDYGKGCHKTVTELEIIWKADLIKKGIKPCECGWNNPSDKVKNPSKCPECSGVIRKHPFLVVNEKIGNGLHQIIDNKFVPFANVNFFCKSCNMVFDRKSGDNKFLEKSTAQFRKSHQVRPYFKNKLVDHLAKHIEICYSGCINKWSNRDDFKCSQELLQLAFDQIYDVSVDLIEISDYGIECSYKKCNGKHIILKGLPPAKKGVGSDYDKFLEENDDDN